MVYRYDLHCHTKEGSKCSDISVSEMVELYHEMGYTGICITDHFTGGMTPLSNKTPWNERVNFYYDIYKSAYKEGEKKGLSVFWGVEYSLAPDIEIPTQATGTDFILFNIDKEWLIDNKNIFREKPKELFVKIREAGGFIIHAHPMLGEELQLFPYYVDAVEIINAGFENGWFEGRHKNLDNINAKKYAEMYKLIETAGTDIHRFDQTLLTGVETKTRCSTISELVSVIKEGQAKPFSIKRQITDYWKQKQNDASEVRNKNKCTN